ncbi:peptide-N4-(N-acetyl-beta-glucosaminyl)asparagine amidase A [Beta vulgaris subsp. vulgaris]|uniref:peptide-N4-(N-acetyl-beta- glucosaminyl)asparagine amidase A n=1 Tax=Beta vulgaris subsp. vulgaris TaxID=3555 RepID=UPI002036846A|nr:peptide-N4-(N-acetyl-beta-glucosaminyl)asparagine amidase A [Beta vulgaris subsp. vulgaris]
MHFHYSFFIIIFFTSLSTTISQPENHFLKPPSSSLHLQPQESIELTLPLSTTNLPIPPPECTLSVFNHSFAYTYSQPPFNVTYSPPLDCPPPWSHAVLQFSGEISGEQYDRIAGVWVSGVEILRTSTPEPSENGTFWKVEKDITRYMSVLQQSNVSFSMMLENIVNDEFTGIYNVSVSILFYKDAEEVVNVKSRKLGLGLGLGLGSGLEFGDLGGGVYEEPADLVIPIADDGNQDYWFRIESESEKIVRSIEIPINAKRVVLELYVSHHGDDEFWYSNPPTEYIEMNNLTTSRGNGAFREVSVKIDGGLVGFVVPFPVIFTGGINPLSWEPVVAIGAFDLPSYDVELTPYLGTLLDGKSHKIELGVANAISFWLVDANLHVWMDKNSSEVQAGMGAIEPTEYEDEREWKFKQLDGSFEFEIERKSHTSGWVNCSLGNFTTSVAQKLKFENKIEFQQSGTQKTVEQKVKVKTEVKVVSDMGVLISSRSLKREYPLKIRTSTTPGPEEDTSSMITNISHELKEKSTSGNLQTSFQNVQESGGSMLLKDHSVLSGTAQTHQTLSYKGQSGCFLRSAQTAGGELLRDDSSVCSSHLSW